MEFGYDCLSGICPFAHLRGFESWESECEKILTSKQRLTQLLIIGSVSQMEGREVEGYSVQGEVEMAGV